MKTAIGFEVVTVIKRGKPIKKYKNVYVDSGKGGSANCHLTQFEIEILHTDYGKKIA